MSDERLKKTADVARVNRAEQDRPATENREVTDEERLEMFRQQFFQSSLPDLPKIREEIALARSPSRTGFR